jgi:hypothetical protein
VAGNTTALEFALTATDRASGTFNNVGQASERTAKRFGKLKVAGALAIGAVAAAATKFGIDSVKAFSESENAQRELEFAFKKFPALANSSQAAMQKLNAELQKKTKFDDDNIASGQAVLANFKLTGKQIESVTPLLLDYADKMGKDVPGAAKDVGKALLGNAKALKNIGISYKSTGDAGKDFTNVTALMRSKIGGFAESEATTAAGKAAILKNQFGELQEKVGGYLVPVLSKLTAVGLKVVSWINDKAVPGVVAFATKVKTNVTPTVKKLSDWFTNVGLPAIKEFGGWVGTQLQPKIQAIGDIMTTKVVPALQAAGVWFTGTGVPALRSFGGWVQKNADWLKAVGVAVLAAVAAVKIYNTTMLVWGGIQKAGIAIQAAWNAVMALNPIGVIVVAIVGLVAGLTYFFTKTKTGQKIWATFTRALSTGWAAIKDAFAKGWAAVSGFMGKVFAIIKKVWGYTPYGLIINNFGKIVAFFKGIPGKIWAALSALGGFVKKVFSYTPLGLVVMNFGKIVTFIKGIPRKILTGLGNVKDLLLSAGGDVIQGLQNGITGGVSRVLQKVKDLANSIKDKFKGLLDIFSPSKVFHGYGRNIVEGLVGGLDKNREKAAAAIARIAEKIKNTKGLQGESRLLKYVKAEGRKLDTAWRNYDRAATRLAKSQEKLAGLYDSRKQMRLGVKGGITGQLDLAKGIGQDSTDANGYTVKGKTTFSSVAGQVKSLAAKAKAFAGKLSRLVKLGIPAGLVQQVAGMGIEEGAAVADALLTGTAKDIRGLQQSWATLNKYANAAGASVAGQQYDRQIKDQKADVKAKKAKAKASKAKTDALAKAIAREVAKIKIEAKVDAKVSVSKRDSAEIVQTGTAEIKRNGGR